MIWNFMLEPNLMVGNELNYPKGTCYDYNPRGACYSQSILIKNSMLEC